MAGYSQEDSVQAVGAVGGVSDGQQRINELQQDATTERLRWKAALEDKQAAHTYSCYMLVIQVINHLSLDKIDTQVIAESQLMDVEHEMQSKLIDISKSISAIQSQSQSYIPYSVTHDGGTNSWSPDAFLGLNEDYYKIGETQSDWGQENVSSSFQSDVDTLQSALKQLFYCNTDTTAPTVGDLTKISNPNLFQGGKDFDMTSMWNKLQGEASAYNRSYSTDMAGNAYGSAKTFNVIGTSPSDHASLIQQYIFYKAQLAVDGGSVDAVNNANGDISKLINFSFDGTGDDQFLNQVMGIISTLDGQVSVARNTALNPWMNTTSAKVLDLILQDQRYNYQPKGASDTTWYDSDAHTPINNKDYWYNDGNGNARPQDLAQDTQVGLYGAFSYAGFNSFWSKASSTTDEQTPTEIPFMGTAEPYSHPTSDLGPWDAPYASYRDHNGTWSFWTPTTGATGVMGTDLLAATSSGLNMSVTNLGTASGTESTNMQELTSNEGENVNIGQSAIKALNNAIETFDSNQMSS